MCECVYVMCVWCANASAKKKLEKILGMMFVCPQVECEKRLKKKLTLPYAYGISLRCLVVKMVLECP